MLVWRVGPQVFQLQQKAALFSWHIASPHDYDFVFSIHAKNVRNCHRDVNELLFLCLFERGLWPQPKLRIRLAARYQRSVFSCQLDQKHNKTSAVFSVYWKHFSAFRGEVIDKESIR
jgi:hypothetical protein